MSPTPHQRFRIGHDQAGALHRDQCQEQAEAHRDGHAQRMRNAVDDMLAHFKQADDDEQAARDEHRAQRRLPRHAHAQHHGVGEVGVQAHARRHADRVVGVQAHDDGAQRRREAGSDEYRVLGHAGIAEDGGVDENDISHRQEGGDPGNDFGTNSGAVIGELEILIEERHGALLLNTKTSRGEE
jgi:hypothetical protein